MARKVKTVRKNGKVLYREITDDGKPVEIEQKITAVKPTHVQVISRNHKKYWVKLSDIVRMTMQPKVNDTAIVKTFQEGWLVTDLISYENTQDKWATIREKIKKGIATAEETTAYKLEVKRQRKSTMDLLGGY